MKNPTILICLLLLSNNIVLAQDKGYIAVSVGPSIPIGDFASKNINNVSAGFAAGGAIFDISFAYKFGKNFGLSAMLHGQANGIDEVALESSYNKQIGGSWNVRSKPWSIGGLMFGAYGSFPISEKVSFDTRAMVGFLSATSPELNITLNGSGGAAWVKQSAETALPFSVLLGGGFKFDVRKRVCLLLNMEYIAAKPEFRNVEITSSNGGAPETSTYSQSIRAINFGFGLGLRI